MKIERKQLLVFGYGLTLISGFLAFRGWMKGEGLLIIILLAAASLVLLIFTITGAQKLIPFYKKWMAVMHVIGRIITTVILSGLFYFIFGIVGIVLRLLGKDLLDEKIEANRDSYWIAREKKKFDKESYTKQY